jgi:hypothetical protein
VVGQITPHGLTNLGSRHWMNWAVFNASVIPIICFFSPVINDRSLEDIDELFESSGTQNVVSNARTGNENWQVCYPAQGIPYDRGRASMIIR